MTKIRWCVVCRPLRPGANSSLLLMKLTNVRHIENHARSLNPTAETILSMESPPLQRNNLPRRHTLDANIMTFRCAAPPAVPMCYRHTLILRCARAPLAAAATAATDEVVTDARWAMCPLTGAELGELVNTSATIAPPTAIALAILATTTTTTLPAFNPYRHRINVRFLVIQYGIICICISIRTRVH